MRKKVLGQIILALGIGMFIAIIIPHWSFLAAVILIAIGIMLIKDRC